MTLAGRLIVVTGASSGLGREISRRLAVEEGAAVVLAARRRDRLQELAAEIHDAGGSAWVVPMDLAESDGPRRLWAESLRIGSERGSPVFGLVLNAGVTFYGPSHAVGADEIRRIIDVNLSSAVDLATLALASFRERSPAAGDASGLGPVGAILAVTSLGALVPMPYQSVYAASKHGLQAYLESASAELRYGSWPAGRGGPGGRPVVTIFAPGGIATEMLEHSGLADRFGARTGGQGGGGSGSRFNASPEEMARAALSAWKRERRLAVAGAGSRLVAVAGRLLPRRLLLRLGERLYRP